MRGAMYSVLVGTVLLGGSEVRSAEAPPPCAPGAAIDRPAQEAAVRQLATSADVIGIATATFEAPGVGGYIFSRVLKGQRKPGIEFQFRRRAGSCPIETHPRVTYLIYAANGELLRAAPQAAKGKATLPFDEELAVITQSLKTQQPASPPAP
ncbi:MAG: hypothetical protein ABI859_18140 [Pseudomonadota bacterium]